MHLQKANTRLSRRLSLHTPAWSISYRLCFLLISHSTLQLCLRQMNTLLYNCYHMLMVANTISISLEIPKNNSIRIDEYVILLKKRHVDIMLQYLVINSNIEKICIYTIWLVRYTWFRIRLCYPVLI